MRAAQFIGQSLRADSRRYEGAARLKSFMPRPTRRALEKLVKLAI